MSTTAWDRFFEEAVREALVPHARVLDVGAGLRIDGSKGNIEDATRAWIKPLVARTTYEVLDPVDAYRPDIVADVMDMPQVADASYDVVICLAVLEHVPRPWDAMKEMYRVLKPGGTFIGYVPFLSPYHAMPGYYGDFFRYTDEGIRSMAEAAGFVEVRLAPVRGPVETLVHLLPGKLPRRLLGGLVRGIDGLRRSSGHQVSGYDWTAKKR